MRKRMVTLFVTASMLISSVSAFAQETYYWKVYAVSDSANSNTSLAASGNEKIVFVQEDWKDYETEGSMFDSAEPFNGGFGWAGPWSCSKDSIVTENKDLYIENILTYPYDVNANVPDENKALMGSKAGFWSNGPSIYRNLAAPIGFDEENEFYLTWTSFGQSLSADNTFVGAALIGDSMIEVGATGSSADSQNKIAIKTPDGNVSIGDKNMIIGNHPYVYVAKITVDPDGMDKISLNAYYFGVDLVDYPTEWDLEVEYDIDNSDEIRILAYQSNSSNTYHAGMYLYKPRNEFTENETESYIKTLIATLPAADEIEITDIAKYEDVVIKIDDALTWFDSDVTALDTEGRYEAYKIKAIDATKISTPVNIRADMNTRIYNYDPERAAQGNDANALMYDCGGNNVGWREDIVKELPGWEQDWSTVDGKFNIYNIDGVKYELKVDTVPSYSSDGQAVMGTTDPETLYYEYDIDNGYYSSINVLASEYNTFYSSLSKYTAKFGIILVYEDGSKEVKLDQIYPASEDGTKYGLEQMSSSLWKRDGTDAQTTGYAHVHEFTVDPNKKLDKIQLLKAYTELNEDLTDINYDNGLGGMYWTYYATSEEPYEYTNEAGEEVTTTLGEYLMSKYAPEGDPNSYYLYGKTFRANVFAISAVSTIDDSKKNIMDIINSWPEAPTTEQAAELVEQFENVSEAIEDMKSLGSDVSDLEANSKYIAMKEATALLKPIPVRVNIDSLFNTLAYGDDSLEGIGQNPNLTTGPNTGFEINSFKNKDIWKYEWGEEDIFNVLELDSNEYRMKVMTGINNNDPVYNSVWRNSSDNTVETIDVEDGVYTNLSVIANSDTKWYSTNHNTGYIAFNLVYSDNTKEFVYSTIYGASEDVSSRGMAQVSAAQISAGTVDNEPDGTLLTDGTLYAHKYDFPVNPDKILTSIEVVQYKAVFNDDRTGIQDEISQDPDIQDFRSTIFAITLSEYMSDYIEDVKAEVEPLIAALPETVTSENMEQVEQIKNIIDEAIGYGVDPSVIEGYEKFEAIRFNFTEISSIDKHLQTDSITLNVNLTAPTKTEYLTKDNIALYEGEELSGEDYTITAIDEADGLAGSFSITLPNAITPKSYTLKLNIGYLISNYTYEFESGSPVQVTAQAIGSDESVLENISDMAGDLMYVSVDINSEIETEYAVIVAIYDENGKIYSIETVKDDVLSIGSTEFDTEYFEIPENATEEWSYKVMTFNNLDSITPLAATVNG